MDNTCNMEQELTAGVFQLPGEPSIVINGLPPMAPEDGLVPCHVSGDSLSCKDTGFGEWLVGREVRKLFGEQFYSGKVTEFDKEMWWYRVVYEDGDLEDLEWKELQEILQPLDITVPLKTVASKIIRGSQKSLQKSRKTGAGGVNHGKGKEKEI
ncbi:hypothetical protein M9H77_36520 [Catharanthus roseus]|uniref:Uncharacterized protein n=1 Tax=Catharanthus roseus TaxID=4058 RepID=A0ACB9ZVT2_CATRO|nr:hypothetical protein M9H77_36520 [Catharanthus roseus]